jgi:23S rRNA pseudouridine2605 synthase
MPERLQKVMSSAGLGARRVCEQMILDGHVRVNGQLVESLPVLVEETDRVEVDGRPIHREKKVYFLLHKPRGVVVTNSDPAGRTRAVDLVNVPQRVFPVGRLETDSSGLLVMTNDGELANRLTHPRYEVPKTYEVEADGYMTGEDIQKLLSGVYLAEGRTRVDRLRVAGRSRTQTWLEITLPESRNRQIRRMLARLGHKVRRLSRISMGKLTLRGLGVGRFRPLTQPEINYLMKITGLRGGSPNQGGPGGEGGRPGPRGNPALRSAPLKRARRAPRLDS